MKRGLLMLSLLGGIILSSCKAPEPNNQIDDRGHEMPWRTEIVFTPGSITKEEGYFADGFTASNKSFSYNITTNAENGELIFDAPVRLNKGTWYDVVINFYNKSGVLLNKQYLTDEQLVMHQFFFISYRKKNENDPYPTQRIKSQITYRYSDTKELNGVRHPIGFKGALRLIDAPEYDDFYLNLVLVHVTPPGRKTDKAGNFYPFDAPSNRLMGVTDINMQIPIIINK